MAEAGEDDEEGAPDEAAAAFEALRREFYELRRFVVLSEGQRPDYAPTLGAVAASLAKIEAHPALQLTPQAHAQQLRAVQEAAQRQGEQALTSATSRVSNVAGELARTLDQARRADRQNWRLVQVGGGALALGAVLWAVLSGPVARALPASWAVPEKMAAATLALDRWHAGERIMQSGSPASWRDVVDATELAKANAPALAACKALAARTGKPQHCVVRIEAPPKT